MRLRRRYAAFMELRLDVTRQGFGRDDEPDVTACLLAWNSSEGPRAELVVRPAISDEEALAAAKDSTGRLERLFDPGAGPSLDGWQERSDGPGSCGCAGSNFRTSVDRGQAVAGPINAAAGQRATADEHVVGELLHRRHRD
jgi:hypothetical protein